MQDIERHSASSEGDKRIANFFVELSKSPSRILILSYEGTLGPFYRRADRTAPFPLIPPLLRQITDTTDTRLVISTGGRVRDVSRLLDLRNIEMWECHGLERLTPDGAYETLALDPRLVNSIEKARELLVRGGLGEVAEYKPGGLAIHWEDREVICGHVMRKVLRVWSTLTASCGGLRLMPFEGGVELRIETRSKGDVVRAILSKATVGSAVACVGGDLTDEDAFGALHHRGLTVLVRDEHRPTIADVWLRAPEGVAAFLADWSAACGHRL